MEKLTLDEISKKFLESNDDSNFSESLGVKDERANDIVMKCMQSILIEITGTKDSSVNIMNVFNYVYNYFETRGKPLENGEIIFLFFTVGGIQEALTKYFYKEILKFLTRD